MEARLKTLGSIVADAMPPLLALGRTSASNLILERIGPLVHDRPAPARG
jgi:hypothetical protein